MQKLFDTIALTEDIPSAGLKRGHVGTVVEIHEPGKTYEAEFSGTDGEAYALEVLSPDQFLVLLHERQSAS